MKDLKHGFFSAFVLFFLLLQMCHNPSITQVNSISSIDSIINANLQDDCNQEVFDSLNALKAQVRRLKLMQNHKFTPKDTTRLDNVKLY